MDTTFLVVDIMKRTFELVRCLTGALMMFCASTIAGATTEPQEHQADLRNLCRGHEVIAENRAIIKFQKRVAALSGVADQQQLYNAGQKVVLFEKLVAEESALFKKQTGTKFDLKMCDN